MKKFKKLNCAASMVCLHVSTEKLSQFDLAASKLDKNRSELLRALMDQFLDDLPKSYDRVRRYDKTIYFRQYVLPLSKRKAV